MTAVFGKLADACGRRPIMLTGIAFSLPVLAGAAATVPVMMFPLIYSRAASARL